MASVVETTQLTFVWGNVFINAILPQQNLWSQTAADYSYFKNGGTQAWKIVHGLSVQLCLSAYPSTGLLLCYSDRIIKAGDMISAIVLIFL